MSNYELAILDAIQADIVSDDSEAKIIENKVFTGTKKPVIVTKQYAIFIKDGAISVYKMGKHLTSRKLVDPSAIEDTVLQVRALIQS